MLYKIKNIIQNIKGIIEVLRVRDLDKQRL
jgi:hypothetical protein